MKQFLFSIGSFFMIFISGIITDFNSVLMFVLLGAFVIFLILAISSMVQKNGKQTNFLFSIGSIFMFLVAALIGDSTPVSNNEGDKNSNEVNTTENDKENLNDKNDSNKEPDTSIDNGNNSKSNSETDTDTSSQPYTKEELESDPTAPSTDTSDYNSDGEYVPADGPTDNPADYNSNGDYKPAEDMTQEEIEQEIEEMLGN